MKQELQQLRTKSLAALAIGLAAFSLGRAEENETNETNNLQDGYQECMDAANGIIDGAVDGCLISCQDAPDLDACMKDCMAGPTKEAKDAAELCQMWIVGDC